MELQEDATLSNTIEIKTIHYYLIKTAAKQTRSLTADLCQTLFSEGNSGVETVCRFVESKLLNKVNQINLDSTDKHRRTYSKKEPVHLAGN